MKHVFYFLALLVLAGIANPSGAFSQAKELNFKMTHQIVESEAYDVEDIDGHRIGTAKGNGLGYFDDGGVTVLNVYFIFDYVNGEGKFTGYYIMDFVDESNLVIKADGVAGIVPGENKTTFTADITFIAGSGKYAGITGSGSMTGQRKNGVESGAPVYLDVRSTYEIK